MTLNFNFNSILFFFFWQLVSGLGWALYEALDYGCKQEEQNVLSPDLEQMIDFLTSAGKLNSFLNLFNSTRCKSPVSVFCEMSVVYLVGSIFKNLTSGLIITKVKKERKKGRLISKGDEVIVVIVSFWHKTDALSHETRTDNDINAAGGIFF